MSQTGRSVTVRDIQTWNERNEILECLDLESMGKIFKDKWNDHINGFLAAVNLSTQKHISILKLA